MKLGTESKNKTITAAVLLLLAIFFVGRWLLTSNSGATAAASPVPAVATTRNAQTEPPQDNPAAAKRQSNRRSDQKYPPTPAWKPSLDPSLNLKALEEAENIKYEGTGRNPFQMTEELPTKIDAPIASARPVPAPGPTVPAQYVPPPIKLKFYGYSTKTGQKTVFLAQDKDTVFLAHEGDIVGRRYKVVRINPNSVEIMDLLTNNKQTINLTS